MAAAIHLATTALSSQLRRQVWQGNELAEADSRVISSGYAALDQLLPGQGWSAGGLTELLIEHEESANCACWPALRHLTAQAERHVMLVAPPYQPCASALRAWGIDVERVLWVRASEDQSLWAAAQALKQDGIGACWYGCRMRAPIRFGVCRCGSGVGIAGIFDPACRGSHAIFAGAIANDLRAALAGQCADDQPS
jgi:hypothetical protein